MTKTLPRQKRHCAQGETYVASSPNCFSAFSFCTDGLVLMWTHLPTENSSDKTKNSSILQLEPGSIASQLAGISLACFYSATRRLASMICASGATASAGLRPRVDLTSGSPNLVPSTTQGYLIGTSLEASTVGSLQEAGSGRSCYRSLHGFNDFCVY